MKNTALKIKQKSFLFNVLSAYYLNLYFVLLFFVLFIYFNIKLKSIVVLHLNVIKK